VVLKERSGNGESKENFDVYRMAQARYDDTESGGWD
jgi:hypothetical protein